jgi:twitching motility protein PilT
MRDVETIEIALEASETGHLVLSTLHTTDAAKTVDRIVGVFPKNEEQIIRTRLANAFRFIVSQRLIPKADSLGRVAAIEILRSNSRTCEYIERGGSGEEGAPGRRDEGRRKRGHADVRSGDRELIRKRVIAFETAPVLDERQPAHRAGRLLCLELKFSARGGVSRPGGPKN